MAGAEGARVRRVSRTVGMCAGKHVGRLMGRVHTRSKWGPQRGAGIILDDEVPARRPLILGFARNEAYSPVQIMVRLRESFSS